MRAYLDCSKIYKLSGKGRNAALFIQPVITSLWGIWVGIPVMSIVSLKCRKWPNFETYQNSVMTSLWHTIKTKKLSPPGEATHITVNISYLYNLQSWFIPKIISSLNHCIIVTAPLCGLWVVFKKVSWSVLVPYTFCLFIGILIASHKMLCISLCKTTGITMCNTVG